PASSSDAIATASSTARTLRRRFHRIRPMPLRLPPSSRTSVRLSGGDQNRQDLPGRGRIWYERGQFHDQSRGGGSALGAPTGPDPTTGLAPGYAAGLPQAGPGPHHLPHRNRGFHGGAAGGGAAAFWRAVDPAGRHAGPV